MEWIKKYFYDSIILHFQKPEEIVKPEVLETLHSWELNLNNNMGSLNIFPPHSFVFCQTFHDQNDKWNNHLKI